MHCRICNSILDDYDLDGICALCRKNKCPVCKTTNTVTTDPDYNTMRSCAECGSEWVISGSPECVDITFNARMDI